MKSALVFSLGQKANTKWQQNQQQEKQTKNTKI
jgi:hypothetical protein